MFKLSIVTKLGTLQFYFLLGAGLLNLCGAHVSWVITLMPLWLLFGVVVGIWCIAAVIWRALMSICKALT
jgi:hypothetical protein